MSQMETLQQVDFFRGLDDSQLAELNRITAEEHYSQGAVICQQGDVADSFYIIGQGQAEVRLQERDGTQQALVYLGTGQVIGEMTLVDEGLRSATVIASDPDTVVYSIPHRDFHALCEQYTAIGYQVMRNIAQDLSFKLRHRDTGAPPPPMSFQARDDVGSSTAENGQEAGR
jgi:CRP-like cAMP-binding protein